MDLFALQIFGGIEGISFWIHRSLWSGNYPPMFLLSWISHLLPPYFDSPRNEHEKVSHTSLCFRPLFPPQQLWKVSSARNHFFWPPFCWDRSFWVDRSHQLSLQQANSYKNYIKLPNWPFKREIEVQFQMGILETIDNHKSLFSL